MNKCSKKRKLRAQVAVWTVLLSLSSIGMAAAQNAAQKADTNFTLDSVIVTAQRTETRDLATPATVTVLDAKELKNSGARTVFDALAFTQGITNFSYGPGGQDYGAMDSRVVIRGFDRGALVLVNGAPINLLNKNSLDSIPMEAVERIEIVKGASSTLYGSEAFGGVINIITKKGGEPQAVVGIAAGNIGYRKYSANYTDKNVGFFYSKQEFGAQDRTSPDRSSLPDDISSNKLKNYYQKRGEGDKENINLTINLSDKWNFNYMRSESNNEYGTTPYWDPTTDPTNKSAKINAKTYLYNDVKDNLTFTYEDKNNAFKSIAFFGSRDLYGKTTDNYARTTKVNDSNFKAKNIGLDTQKSWKLRGNKDNLLVGILASREEYQNTVKPGQEADRHNYAVYAQYSYQLSPEFTTIVGARAQQIDDPVKNQNVFIPQIQTVYKINDTSSWYTNVGKAFQMPPLNQYFEKNKLANGRDLKPQEGWNYETGYKIINGDSSWKFAVYKMDFKNKFDYTKDDQGKDVLINKGKFRNTGFEAEYNKIINNHWKANLGFNYGNPEAQNDKGGWDQTYPKMQVSAGVQYEMDKLQTSLTCNYLTKRQDNRYGETIPSAITLNAVVNYNMSAKDTVTLNLNNILDKNNVITHGGYDYWDLPFNWTLSWNHSL